MRTIIHDLDKINKLKFSKDDKVYNALKCFKNCIGCFSCWVKHPKRCILNDNYSNIVDDLKDSDELIIISKCRYGCYSSNIKKVLERCIGYVLPYFTIRNNEIHHSSRYNKKLKLSTYFYGEISNEDKIVLEHLVKANAVNLNAKEYNIYCFNSLKELKRCIRL